MPKLILRFGERDLQECAVGTHPVSIGRLPDNMIVIDNPAVSGRHARVFREGDHYVVEDLKSTNGTFVNDKPIARHTLLEGDVVLLGKHSLVFTLAGDEPAPMPAKAQAFVPDVGGTMMLDTLKQKELLAGLDHGRPSQMHSVIPRTAIPAPPARTGSVRVISGSSDRDSYQLTAVTTIIGKADNAQIRTRGWFKPKVSAAIARKGDGFTVTPMDAAVLVNKQKITGRRDLANGDTIEVSGLTLEFKLV
ncbi:MAG TPA: FHA domain-containing protein [Vicinamibacterales bacterium]|nr:FHA domain-containing protein [Vicinamibacterales bacterium]